MLKVILLLSLLCAVSAKIVRAHTASCSGGLCEFALMNYIKSLITSSHCDKAGNYAVVRISHQNFKSDIGGFYVNGYRIDLRDPSKRETLEFDEFDRENNANLLIFKARFLFSKTTTNYGCVEMNPTSNFFIKKCELGIDYINNKQDEIIKTYHTGINELIQRIETHK